MAEVLIHGRPGGTLRCGTCDGMDFTSNYVHSPYGHDAGERTHRCNGCGATWAGSYYDTVVIPPPAKEHG